MCAAALACSLAAPVALLAQDRGSVTAPGPLKPDAPNAPLREYVYDSGSKRDPFIPLITADGRFVQLERTPEEADASVLKLEGIIYDKYGLSYAIVDSSVVKVGDEINHYQVLKIDEGKVVFIREGQTKEVFLEKED